jgi:hypothetical protein
MAVSNGNGSNLIKYGASFRTIAALAANTAEVVVLPASNVNGILLHSANFVSEHASNGATTALLAKTSAPANAADGDGILSGTSMGFGTNRTIGGQLSNPILIPAGKGLYFITGTVEVVGSRSALYTLL